MNGLWGESPFAALTLCLSAGILSSPHLPTQSFTGLALGTLAALIAGYLAVRADRLRMALWLSLTSIILTGILLVLSQRAGTAAGDLRNLLSRGAIPLNELVSFDGCVVDESRRKGNNIVTLIRVDSFRYRHSRQECRGKVLFHMVDSTPLEEPIPGRLLEYGERIRGWGRWRIPRSYKNPGTIDAAPNLRLRGIQLIGRIKSPRLLEMLDGKCGHAWNGAAARVRSHIRHMLDAVKGEGEPARAAVLSSLLLGDSWQLDRDTRESFQNSGTYHVLVVSGLHVGWIAWMLVHLFRLIRVPRTISTSLLALTIVFYATIVGFRAGIARSLWMFLFYLVGRTLFRRASPVNVLFGASFILLAANPLWIYDAGFQLSFLAVASIILMGVPLTDKWLHPLLNPMEHLGDPDRLFPAPGIWSYWGRRMRTRSEILIEAIVDSSRWFSEGILNLAARSTARIARFIGSVLVISISIQFWLTPVLAFYFNRLSWISPAANLIVVPLASAALVLAMGAAAVGDILMPAAWTFGPPSEIAGLLTRTAAEISDIPGAWQRCATPSALWILVGICLFFGVCFLKSGKLWAPCLFVGLHLTFLSLGYFPFRAYREGVPGYRKSEWGTKILRLSFLDVGQGDAIVLRLPDNQVWVMDAGGISGGMGETSDTSSFDIGEAVVSRYLWNLGLCSIDRLVLSHPHQDHAGGMRAILRNFAAPRLEYSESRKPAVLARILQSAKTRGISTYRVTAGRRERFGEVEIETLHPPEGDSSGSVNDNSLVLKLDYGKFSALFAGDLEGAGEKSVLSLNSDLRSTLLKVAHHGSRSATGESFLNRVRPKWAVISAGRGNPADETLQRLLHHGVTPLVTAERGAIFFETDGTNYMLSSHVCGLLATGKLP